MYGNEIEASVLSVDPGDQFTDLSFQLRCVRQAGTCHLDEDDLVPPLWIVMEELLKCLELLDDTLDDIELIPTDDDLLAFIQCAKGLQFGLDARSETLRGQI